MSSHPAPTPATRAFTLVEILVVVAILGVAGAIVLPTLLQPGTLGIQAASRMVIADILFAQNDAIAFQSTRRVVFNTAENRYWLTADTTFALNSIPSPSNALGVRWKDGTTGTANFIFDFDNDDRFQGVQIQNANFGGNPVLEFDALGGPTSGGTIDLVAGTTRFRVTVAAFTGRVSVQQVS